MMTSRSDLDVHLGIHTEFGFVGYSNDEPCPLPESYLDNTKNGATFEGPEKLYRLSLWRQWDEGLFRHANRGERVAFIGLNPSTADEKEDDATIRRCIGFAKFWGFNGMVMLNLFAFRARNPVDMVNSKDPIGMLNDSAIFEATKYCKQIVACWGAHGSFLGRDRKVRDLLHLLGRRELHHLGLTKDKLPKHPLYLKGDIMPAPWVWEKP